MLFLCLRVKSLNILMKLYNIELKEINPVNDLKSWQGPYLYNKLPLLNLNYNICLIDLCCDSTNWDNLDIVKTTTDINNSDIDIIFFLISDHRYCYPPENLGSKLYKIITAINKPIIYIGWNYIKDQHAQYQIKYPIWSTLCAEYKHRINNNEYIYFSDIDITSTHKKYLYSSLSNIIYGFRLVNLVEFQKSKYYNKSLILVNTPNKPSSDKIFWEWEMKGKWPMHATRFKQIIPTLPINTSTSLNDNITLANGVISDDIVFNYNNAAYADSYVNIIVESVYEDIFFSEKTFKPMLANQFFVIIAGKGSIAALREMGFDTYDDIIDHDIYDNEPDDTRIQAVHKLLRYMQYYDWKKIYTDTVERRKKNRQLLLDLTFEKKFVSELEQMVTTIVKHT